MRHRLVLGCLTLTGHGSRGCLLITKSLCRGFVTKALRRFGARSMAFDNLQSKSTYLVWDSSRS
jgi:hypothetical protein